MHTYRGPNGLIINHNGDFSGMAILRYQGTEMEVPAAEIAPYVEQERIVREIAASDPLHDGYDGHGTRECRYCEQALVAARFEMEQDGKMVTMDRFVFRPEMRVHAPDCLWVGARAIVARLDAPPDSRLGEETP